MRSFHRRGRGFTLIELMFSMAIGSIILILAVTMLSSSGDGYERVGGSVASEREARALMTQLAADLSTAKFHENTLMEKSSAMWPADRIGFLSLQPAAAQTDAGRIGDLCAVNYYIKDLTIGGKTVRCLMRGFRESGTIKKTPDQEEIEIPGVFDALLKLIKTPNNDPNKDPNPVTELFDPLDEIDEPIAFGVVSFEARPKSRDAAGKWIDWVPNATTGPKAIAVKLVIARRELAGKLKSPTDWDGKSKTSKLLGEPAQDTRNKNLEVYATSLRFGNNAEF